MTPTAPRWSDLGVRTLSAAVLIPAALLDVWLGGVWFELAIALLAVLMAQEWVAMVHNNSVAQFALHAAGALSGAVLPLDAGIGACLLAIASISLLSAALMAMKAHPVSFWSWLGVAYVGLPAMALVVLRSSPEHGLLLLIWLFVSVWAADISAYFAGRLIGGPKLAPVISPKKTWAGLGGAVVGATLASLLVAKFAGLTSPWALALAGAALGVVEQAGDLFKSALKRYYGVKDSGHLIPGHGGVIDRVDGLVASAVAALLIIYILGGAQVSGQSIFLW